MEQKKLSRRRMLQQGGALLAALAVISWGAGSRRATAESAIKSDFHYQDRPKDGKKCLDCSAYIAEKGACRVLGEVVDPNGWCIAFSQKS